MAEKTPPSIAASPSVDTERTLICLEAAWEVAAWTDVLSNIAATLEEPLNSQLLLRGATARLRALASALTMGIGDEVARVDELRRVVRVERQVSGGAT